MRLSFFFAAAASAALILTPTAAATPVATSEPEYQGYGAVFPDPLAVCQQNCDPNSRGHTNATQFIQWEEFNDAITFMNQQDDWRRYMEVLPLDGKKGEGSGTKAGEEMWPGNNLGSLEWTPREEYQSAGLATSDRGRLKSDLVVIRVTDENVPDKNKKRYALSLSIHGIERAGAEGGIRAMEEIVTAVSEDRGDESILPDEVRAGAPSWREVLANTIVYFTFPNPDGWRRGSIVDTGAGPGVFFQRYNGNGVDPNRDWPDIGYTFRGYSGGSEPETRAFQAFYRDVQERGGPFAAGDDLHGQPFADALSYTLLPHGRHDLDKDYRIREAAKLINRAQYEATKWSPLIQDNDEPPPECIPEDAQVLGAACDQIYAQTWGSVYDTINYTTTGTLGDWFDSSLGLDADGIDNEMSFSHLDRNIAFEPQGEQLHVAGNKAIIYSHIADMLRPPSAVYTTEGTNGYVANRRLTREQVETQPAPPPGTSPQDDRADEPPTGADPESGSSVYEFPVERDFDTFSGGMRVDVRATNVQGIGSGVATLEVQCMGCDEHVGVSDDAGEWITVADDYNQSPVYAQAGLTAAVNRPDAFTGAGEPVRWRAVVDAPGGIPAFSVDFTAGPATSDGATGGDPPPLLRGYDVANTDFFGDLNGHAKADDDRFGAIDPGAVIDGSASLAGYDTIVLADEALPGYTGAYQGEVQPTGPPTADFTFTPDRPTSPGQGPTECVQNDATTNQVPFTIGANDGNGQATIRITWSRPTSDYDLYVYLDPNGNGTHDEGEPEAASPSAGFINTSETVTLQKPKPGDYVIAVVNCSAPSEVDPWTGTAEFTPLPDPGASAFTAAQKDTWMAKLRDWVGAGGNLVLTDGALRGLSELTGVPGSAVEEQVVYVGQSSFQICTSFDDDGTCAETAETLDDPLARNVDQFAARFNGGMRRQTFEPTPLGFAIQNESGADASFSRQFDVDLQAFQAAGGRPAAGSADSGARNAQAVTTRVTLGEIQVGSGKVRIQGALLPQPSTEFDHPLGLEPYAMTYTGYILFCNLIDCAYEPKPRPQLANAPAPPGPVEVGFDASIDTPLLASKRTRKGRRVPVRVRKTGVRQIDHLEVDYRRTGRGTKKVYKTLKPRLKPRTRRIRFNKGRIGRTYLLRIRAVGKNGVPSAYEYARLVFPYDERSKKRRRTSAGWDRVKAKRAWRGGYTESSRRGALMRFRTGRGGRIYVIGRKSPNGGVAIVSRGKRRQVVSFRSRKKVRHRKVLAVFNGSPKKRYNVRVRVREGTVAIDGIGVRRR